jgi:GNAT superfamily N-acetyltransferase
MSLIYKIHHISTSDPNLPFLAGKFASLRLQALTVSPGAFASTFETESASTGPFWISRLKRSNVHTFIAVAYPSTFTAEQQTIDTGDLVGSATVLGPVPRKHYHLPLSNGPAIGEDDEETKWHMTAVYNSPEHRGKGVAKLLINYAVQFATKGGRLRSRMRIVIHPKNIVVKHLYNSLGFEPAGNCTFVEAVTANGDEHLLPEDGGASDPEKYLARGGVVMEKVMEWTS